VLRAWGGKKENIKAAQDELIKRAKVFITANLPSHFFTTSQFILLLTVVVVVK
jgi:Fructose-bisphosphate aldolase class-I